ncbi:MAG: hypothetical protein J5I90_06610 [Caldilineales bacterium]|nr:hypothetical protein [Caldilineales bacterium]
MSHRHDEIEAISRRISDLSEESLILLSQYISFLKWQEEQWHSPEVWDEDSGLNTEWLFDLIEHFHEARQAATADPAGMEIKLAPASCGGVIRQAIWQHPPAVGMSVLEYQISVPMTIDLLKLRFAVGVRDGALLSTDNQVAFRLRVNGRQLWSHLKMDVSWESFTVELPSLAGQEAVLQLITDPLGNSRWNWAVWGEPQVIGFAFAED